MLVSSNETIFLGRQERNAKGSNVIESKEKFGGEMLKQSGVISNSLRYLEFAEKHLILF